MAKELTLEEKVLKLLPIGEKRQCKDLIADMSTVGIKNRISLERKLADLVVAKKVKKITQERPRKVFYQQDEYWKLKRLANLADDFNKETSSLSEDIARVIRAAAESEANAGSASFADGKVIQEIQEALSEDREEYGALVASILIKQAFKIIKETNPDLRNKEFYVDSEGLIAPKSLIDEMITSNERKKMLSSDSIGGYQFRHFYEKFKKREKVKASIR